ncbi:transcription factor TFIIIB component B'' homolog [Phlebotomus argentipes]|uniref:transcription factor TFIIIB component B'' homolog n=1 Tax=Phlebotomus argentipes TaxID=94469 RepID=UPI0028937983|nr:transcription factor TFIIIB component B'' homolog [Phlebotomus argentipes]
MSFRRPRVKASANLVLKRPSKNEKRTVKIEAEEVPSSSITEEAPEVIGKIKNEPGISESVVPKQEEKSPKTKLPARAPSPIPDSVQDKADESKKDWEQEEVFKSPDPIPTPSKSEILSDVDREVPSGCLSPTKVRQRIKPTPFFGTFRRNSTHESEDEGRRQRGSVPPESPQTPQTPQMFKAGIPGFMGQRIRTESTCSTISDVSQMRDSHKQFRRIKADESSKTSELRRELSHRLASGKFSDRSRLTMYDMIYYNPTTNPMKSPAKKDKSKSTPERRSSVSSVTSVASHKSEKGEKLDEDDPEIPQQPPLVAEDVKVKDESAMPVPQLKLGPNGEMILDEKSLVIETTGDREARETLANSSIVYDDEYSSNNGFYKRQPRTKDWSDNETIIFYKCLHTVGTDFSLMCTLFTNRTRRDLKLKFKKEERLNMHLVNKALMYPKAFDLDELREELQKNAEELAKTAALDKQAAIEDLKKERKTQRKANNSSKKKPMRNNSRALKQLSDADFAYKMEELSSAKKRRSSRGEAAQKKLPRLENCYEAESQSEVILTEAPVEQEEPEEEAILPNDHEFLEDALTYEDNEEAEEPMDNTQSLDGFTDLQNLDLNNLVIVEEDVDGTTHYKIHLKNPETHAVSEKPLDLPQEVINCIVSAHLGQAN